MSVLDKLGNLGGGFSGNTPTHIQEGYMIGWHIGQITSLEDPEGLGRIQAKLVEVDPSLNIPTEDCLVWVGTKMTLSGLAGGSHEPLGLDSLIAMIPKGGDPRQMLMICSLNNRVDRPHPELNRAYGRYGTSTVNEVFDFWDDSNQSRVQAWPHGATKTVTPDGDIQNETLGGARSVLKQDGAVLLENPKAGMSMSKEGDIIQSNQAAATVNLSNKGEITVATPFATKLELKKSASKMYGPKSALGQLLSVLKDAFGPQLSKAMESLESLKLAKTGNNVVTSAINESLLFLKEIESSLGESTKAAAKALDDILKIDVDELTDLMGMQLSNVLSNNVPAITKEIEKAVNTQGGFTGDTITILEEMMPPALVENLASAIASGQVKDIEQSLAHDPAKLMQALTELILGDSVPGASSLQQMELLQQIDEIEDELLLPFDLNDPNTLLLYTPEQISAILAVRRENIRRLWPESTRSLLTDEMINGAFKAGNPTAHLVAHIQQAMTQDAKDKLDQASSKIELITPTTEVVQGLETENINQIYNATTSSSEIAELISDTTLGRVPVDQLGSVDVSDITVGQLLGNSNPGTIDLTAVDAAQLLEFLPDDLSVNLSDGTTIDLAEILEALPLPTVNLAEILGLDEGVLNIEEMPISELVGAVLNLETLSALDLSTIALEDFLGATDLSNVNVKTILSSLNLDEVNLSDALSMIGLSESDVNAVLGTVQDVVNLIDSSLVTDLSKINIPSLLGGVDLGAVDLSALNLNIDVGAIAQNQLEDIFNKVVDPIITDLQPLLEGVLLSINPMLGAVMDLIGGAKVVLGKAGASMQSAKGTHRVYANDAMAAVESLVGKHAVFATKATAGLKGAKGILGFGDGGGGMVSFGNVAMRAMKQIASPTPDEDKGRPYGWSAGIQLSPDNGVTIGSYIGYGPPPWEGDDYENMKYSDELTDPIAFLNINREQVSLRSPNQRYGIDVNQEGVWINDIEIFDYFYTLNRRMDEVFTLATQALAAATAPPPPTTTTTRTT